jgi:hypothetical protein
LLYELLLCLKVANQGHAPPSCPTTGSWLRPSTPSLNPNAIPSDGTRASIEGVATIALNRACVNHVSRPVRDSDSKHLAPKAFATEDGLSLYRRHEPVTSPIGKFGDLLIRKQLR